MRRIIFLLTGILVFVFIASNVNASVSSYTTSTFAQFCAGNPLTCKKADNTGTVSCPSSNQVVSSIYVHAGDGNTVYELPDSNWLSVLINFNNTAVVSPIGEQHAISWVAVVCTAAPTPIPCEECSQTPTPTPTDSSTPTPTPTSTPTPTPTGDPNQTPAPTSSPSCGQDEHLDASGTRCVKWELGGAPQSNGGGQVLGTSTSDPKVLGASTTKLAATGSDLTLPRIIFGIITSGVSFFIVKKYNI